MDNNKLEKIGDITIPLERIARPVMLISIIFLILSGVLFFLVTNVGFDEIITLGVVKFIFYLIIGVILHELIHGFFFLIFSGFKFNSVRFGFNKEYMAPYAHCNVPLRGWAFIVAALAPLIILGVVPFVYGLLFHMISLYFLGVIFIIGAAGDIVVSYEVLKRGIHYFYQDHSNDMGFTVLKK